MRCDYVAYGWVEQLGTNEISYNSQRWQMPTRRKAVTADRRTTKGFDRSWHPQH